MAQLRKLCPTLWDVDKSQNKFWESKNSKTSSWKEKSSAESLAQSDNDPSPI